MGTVRIGLLLTCLVGAVLALWGFSEEGHWVFMLLLLVALVGVGLSFLPGGPGLARLDSSEAPAPNVQVPDAAESRLAGADALRSRLADLDALRDDGILSAAEHKRKRQALIDAWGLPED